jgi:hypothetical protein
MILGVLLVTGLLIMLAYLDRPLPSRHAVGRGHRLGSGSGPVPGNDSIGTAAEQYSWTELDEVQLRRLLGS